MRAEALKTGARRHTALAGPWRGALNAGGPRVSRLTLHNSDDSITRFSPSTHKKHVTLNKSQTMGLSKWKLLVTSPL